MKPSVSRLNSDMTPRIRLPLDPVARVHVHALRLECLLPYSSLAQEIHVNTGTTIGNYNRSHCSLVELDWSGTPDNAVDITHLSKCPKSGKQERLANTTALHVFNNAGWPKESAPRAFVSGEAYDSSFAYRDEDRNRFVCKADGDLIGPCDGKLTLDQFAHSCNLKGLRPTNDKPCLVRFQQHGIRRRQFQKIYQHVRHNLSQGSEFPTPFTATAP